MTKKSQIQAWLNGFYMENLYGQRMTSKHVHARRRPGVPAPVMIKRKPILHHPWRSEQYGAVVSVNQNPKSDLVEHNSGSWGVRLLHDVLAAVFPVKIKNLWIGGSSASQIAAISWTNLQNRLLWTVCLFGKRPVCIPRYDFAKIFVLPQYHFAKVWFCQNIILPKSCFATISFCQSMPKYCFCQNMVMPTVYRTFPGADVFIDWYIEIICIPLHLRIILCGFHQVTSQGRWFHRNHHPL